jgi:hypothetical protein
MTKRTSFISLLGAGVAAGAMLASGMSAQASTLVSIGLGAVPATVGTSGATTGFYFGSSGTFTSVDVTGQLGVVPDILLGNTIDVSGGGGTLDVWVTATGLTSPTGLQDFVSSLTQNNLTSGWTVTENTFYDPTDTAYGTTDPLASHMFSAIGTDVLTSGAIGLVSPYSVTEEFVITAPGAGSTNSTIDISTNSPVPEPATWAMMIIGLGCIAAGLRLRKDTRAPSLA